MHSDLSRSGARTAKNTYGVQSGWVAHGFTDDRLGCGMIGKVLSSDLSVKPFGSFVWFIFVAVLPLVLQVIAFIIACFDCLM